MLSSKPEVHPHSLADNRLFQRLQSSVCPSCAAAWTSPVRHYWGIRLIKHVFAQNCPSLLGSSSPRNTVPRPSPLIIPNGISIGSAVFVCVPNVMLYNALSVGKKTPQNCLFSGFHYYAGGGPSSGHR